MSENANRFDPRTVERRMWLSYFQDGFYDILFGSLLLTGGIRTLTDQPVISLGAFIGVIIFVLGRMYITIPRIGLVRFGEKRRRRRIVLYIVLAITLSATLVLMTITMVTSWKPAFTASLAVLVLLPGIFLVIAYLLEFRRLAIYGLFFAGAEACYMFWGNAQGGIASVIFGTLGVAYGIILLVMFIRKNPKEEVP